MKKYTVVLLAVLTAACVVCGCAEPDKAESVMVEELPIASESATEASVSKEAEAANEASVSKETEAAIASQAIAAEPLEDSEAKVLGEQGVIVVGTIGAPFTELLTQAKLLLAKEGWELQIQIYEDYESINRDVLEGTLDAHIFAHETYVDSYNDSNAAALTKVAPICYESYGIYSKINQDLIKVKNTSVIGIPAEMPRKARALLFLQDMGWITMQEDSGMTATTADIVENSKQLQWKEYTKDTVGEALKECDYCIIGGDIAILAGLDPETDVLTAEKTSYLSVQTYATYLVSNAAAAKSEAMKVLSETLKGKEMQEYAKEKYQGAWLVLP